MSIALSRKRSRLVVDDDEEDVRLQREPSPAISTVSDTLKRSKTQCELEELGIIDAQDAWRFDVEALLNSKRVARPTGSNLGVHDNWARFNNGDSIIVLCVQGNVQTHYDLLCSVLPDLYNLSPTLQAFVLCHDPPNHHLSSNASFSLPLIQAYEPPDNHFVRLGLLHPLGGGKFPLDALVVIDRVGRRRLVLPCGWGAGKHISTPAGRNIQKQFTEMLMVCVETLEAEKQT